MPITIKRGNELNADEWIQMEAAELREFNVQLSPPEDLSHTLFFLLKDGDHILSMGGLREVKDVQIGVHRFTIFGVVNVISNIKGEGYGKSIMLALKEYAASTQTSTIGFCMPRNLPFYQKCGFQTDTTLTPRFVCLMNESYTTNQDGQYMFYQDGTDCFMQRVKEEPALQIILPSCMLW